MKLYHITEQKNLRNIMQKGLLPNHRRGLSIGRRSPHVWLTDSPAHVIRTQMGSRHFLARRWAIIEVDTETLEADGVDWRTAAYLIKGDGWAFYTHEYWSSAIGPDALAGCSAHLA